MAKSHEVLDAIKQSVLFFLGHESQEMQEVCNLARDVIDSADKISAVVAVTISKVEQEATDCHRRSIGSGARSEACHWRPTQRRHSVLRR